MNLQLSLEELEQIVEALNQKHDTLSSGGTEVLPELQAVNRLSGHASLDDGHWPTATESQRAAAIEHFGSKNRRQPCSRLVSSAMPGM